MTGNIVLFEDQFVHDMRPVVFTRPAFGVTCALYSLYDIASETGARVSYVVRDYITKITERRYESAAPTDGAPTLFLNASVAPDTRLVARLRALLEEPVPFLVTSGQRVAAALVPAGRDIPTASDPEAISPALLEMDLPLRDDDLLKTVDYPYQLIAAQYALFPANIDHKLSTGDYTEVRDGVFVGENVALPETAVFHPEDGPIVLDDNARVLDFTYFSGPVYVGPNSRVIERSSVKEFTCTGHTCKIGGEVEASIIEPYTNKQHHGFLGHAYVGSWVNMGAGTSNSDLKNTYGTVRYDNYGQRIETDMQFLGCIIGDFSKTAINTSIFTGKTVGVASMLYGYVGQNVPSFCNYAKSFGQITEVPAEAAARTQQRMFARRNVEQTPDDLALLNTLFELTRDQRLMSADLPVL